VQTHREPLEILPSAASLTMVLRSTSIDFVDLAAIGAEMTKSWGDALEKFPDTRKGLRPDAFVDVDHSDLIRDPIGMVRRLYSQLENDLSSEVELRMHAFLEAYPHANNGHGCAGGDCSWWGNLGIGSASRRSRSHFSGGCRKIALCQLQQNLMSIPDALRGVFHSLNRREFTLNA
jgi:Sulfotransferase family